MAVVCIDAWANAKGGPAPGGTCTNVGCIPSKALLQSSEHFDQAGHAFAEHGIEVSGLKLDLDRMLARKAQVVRQNKRASSTCQEEQGGIRSWSCCLRCQDGRRLRAQRHPAQR
jgi:dihydrolipoamide dehydrogenase (EC 1.8.1.4)